MGGSRLRIAAVGLHLDRVDQVRELHRVLDEEHRRVVPDQVPVALGRVELDCKAADVAGGIHRPGAASDGREAGEHVAAVAGLLEQRRAGQFGDCLRDLEGAMRGRSAGVDDPLRDALVVEVEDLFAQHEVFQQRRPARAQPQAVLVVRNRDAHVGGQTGAGVADGFLQFVAIAAGGGKGRGHRVAVGVVMHRALFGRVRGAGLAVGHRGRGLGVGGFLFWGLGHDEDSPE